jgi:hypothetical protein
VSNSIEERKKSFSSAKTNLQRKGGKCHLCPYLLTLWKCNERKALNKKNPEEKNVPNFLNMIKKT